MKKLDQVYDHVTSLGIGLTSLCNLKCSHCYSKNLSKKTLTLAEMEGIFEYFPNLQKVNFGTGESILNPDFLKIVDFFHAKKIKIAVTSNGTTIAQMSDEHLKKLDEVDISLDFANAKEHDEWRGYPGLFDRAIESIERCKKLGIEISIATVLMNSNYKVFGEFKKILDKYDIHLRVNLCKPVDTDEFQMSYEEFWESMKIIADNFTLVASSEPVLAIVTDINDHLCGSPCGDSVRLHPDFSVSPCVYVDGNKISTEKFIEMKKQIPKFCQDCDFVDKCRGGCMSRRIFNDNVDKPDEYCPIYRGDKIPEINFKTLVGKEFIHSNYLCTFILK
ncbi:radical SAM protein [Candidatus Parcubacteria bacterium]|jgi:radical SAM protein with 4Fe4S-binding SPASM domain|nr:radical SAM protein [Candidatus Parcubacteria bacterium]